MSTASIVLLRRRKPVAQPWTNQELAELYRVAEILGRAGLPVTTDCGQSDEGEPWFVFQRGDNGEVIAHFARIDGELIAAGSAHQAIIRGGALRDIVARLIGSQPLVLPNSGKLDERIRLHPSVVLTAFVATAYYISTGIDSAQAGQNHAAQAARASSDGGLSVVQSAALASVLAVAVAVVETDSASRLAALMDAPVGESAADGDEEGAPVAVASGPAVDVDPHHQAGGEVLTAAETAGDVSGESAGAQGGDVVSEPDGSAPGGVPHASDSPLIADASAAFDAHGPSRDALAAVDVALTESGLQADAFTFAHGAEHLANLPAGAADPAGVAAQAQVLNEVSPPSNDTPSVEISLSEAVTWDGGAYYEVAFAIGAPDQEFSFSAPGPELSGDAGQDRLEERQEVGSLSSASDSGDKAGDMMSPAIAGQSLNRDAPAAVLDNSPNTLIYQGGDVSVVGFEMGVDRMLIDGLDQLSDPLILDWSSDGDLVMYVEGMGSITFVGISVQDLA